MNNKKNKFLIPLSNESIKKTLLGASIIVGGFGLLGNTNDVYADSLDASSEIIDNNQIDEVAKDKLDDKKVQENFDEDKYIDIEEEKIEEDQKKDQASDTENKENVDTKEVEDNLQVASMSKAKAADFAEPVALADEANNEQNYTEDEKEIKDYSGEERYKETDLQPGDTNQDFNKDDEKVEKDGFKFELKNPSETSSSKREYGYQITIDKETGQRTYTKITVTDSGLVQVKEGEKPMMGKGEKLTPESPEVTFKPNENGELTAGGRQKNLNYEASEETLRHINNKDNPSTSFGMEDNYTKDNPGIKFFGNNFALGYKVNPWPNENDKLELLKLNGSYNEKVFVQGQDIDTGIKVDNIDENAKERLVGQVYNPITNKIVPGASAYIGDDGNIHIQMPKGALKKNAEGKYVVDEESIFNTKDYKALQHLDVKFFARPRTKDEFTKVAETPDESGETGTYVETGAGSADINHKGANVTIDKQGIDRYDHYNLIGDFKLNLDDTRYYDQRFKDGNNDDTSKVTSSAVKPGEPFKVGIVEPENPREEDKSAAEMNEAEDKGEASGRLIMDFIDRENKGKAEEDQWKVALDKGDIANFTITPPKSAKAGDFVAIPIEYTYTNGSKDVHWFHFVVQESTYIKPEYETQVNFPAKEQTAPAKVTEDGKRLIPDHYTLPDTLETDESGNKLATDDSGNKWIVKVDKTTGKVSAKPVEPKDFNGGEKLEVPVISHYVDKQKPGEDITEEASAYFVIEERANMTPRYNAKAGKAGDSLTSDVILNTEDTYNRRPGKYTLDSDTFVDDKGNTWNVTIDEKTGQVTATVPNGVSSDSLDGALLNVPVTAHYYEENGTLEVGTRKTEVQFIGSGTEGKHKYIVDIPFETKVEKDPSLKKGEIKVIKTGELGSKEVSLVIKDSVVDKAQTTEKVLKEKQDALINVGEGVLDGTHNIEEKVEVPFETIVEFDDTLAPGEQRVDVEGAAGEKTRTTTLTIEDGNVTKTESGEFTETKAPVNRVIKVGRNTEGEVVHEEKIPFKYDISYDPSLKSGEYVIDVKGSEGIKTTTWKIKNSKVDGEPSTNVTNPVNAVIRVGQKDFTGEFTHEVKEEIPFTVRIIEDETLEAGKSEVVTQGQAGEKTTKYTQAIKNGEADGELKSESNRTKEPVEQVIRVGKKTATNNVEERTDVPVDIVYKYDPNMEVTKATKGDFTPGGVKTVVTNKYNPETGEIESVKETVVTNAKQEIIVGTKKYTGEFKNVIEEEIPYETEVIFDEELETGTMVVDKAGKPGSIKKEFIQHFENGEQKSTEEKELGRTEAEKRIVRVGSKTEGTHQYKEEIPFKYTVVYDPEMKAGTYEEVTPGKVGERVTIWTIKNSKVVGEPETIETKPVDAVIKIGSKDFTGEFETKKTDFIEFETIYEVDNTMEPGTTKVVQEGQHGEIETTVTHTIVNGEVTESKDGEPVSTKSAINRIVKVGAAKSNGNHEYTNKIPFDVEVRVNPELKKGEYKVVQKGEVGEEKYTLTIEDSKVTNTSEASITKAPVKEIIEVGYADFTGKIESVDKDPVPFETEVTVDSSLAPGEIVEDQAGVLGEQETKLTRTITNGTAGEEVRGETTVTKEPVARKIRIGAKSDGMHEYTNKIPFDVEVRVNPELKKGEYKVVQEGEVGEEKYTVTIENSKVTATSEPITTKEAVKEIVEVGSEDFTGSLETKKTKAIEFETEYIVDNSLEPGTTEVVQEGSLGEEETKVTHTIKNGEVTESVEGDSVQTKAPVKRIVKVGPAKTDGTETITEEIPFEVEVKKDPSLKKGEWKYATDEAGNELKGEKGSQEKTLTIVNSKVTETSDPTVVKQAKNAVILVGDEDFTGEVKHKEHFEIPFEVEVRYNDQLPAGTSKEIQKGVKGSYDVEYTQKIKNGSADGEMTKEESNKVEAKKHIIEVGTKVETPENNYSKEVEVEVEYVYDDTKDKGVVETGEFTPGKVETKVVDKYNPETGKVEQTTEEVVTKAKQKVIVGIKDFTGTYEYKKTCPIPFEVEIIEDKTLAKGEKVVDQEGKPGSKTTSYEQNIKNGEPEGEAKKISEEISEQPTKHIVRIGTKESEGETKKTIEREIPYETKLIYDETLESGTQKIENEGKAGKEEVTIIQKIKDSKPVGEATETTKTITEKEDRLVRIGVKPVEKMIELGNNTEYRHNPELKAGEEKVIEEGSKGSVKYTTTFNKETGKLEVKEERTEPKNKVVEYGSKTDGEFTYESEKAYDIIIRENPDLEAGKTNVIQEGKPGKTETTVKIENSKEVFRDTKTITEKQDKIIEIGTKNVCEIPPVKPNPNPDPKPNP
ncbi:G5 domain-containing protein, partial [Anaerococcus sp.]|uniref:G5 domain-containing protein n=1 Tax=Anaerococcus sp. TaxID=1872515 RepID=UPI0027B92B80